MAGGKWEKGKSANPSGRPKEVEGVRALAQAYCQRALLKLVSLMDSEDERVAQAAANAVLDRGIGKPIQATEITGKDGADLIPGREVSDTELARRVAFMLEQQLKKQHAQPEPDTVQ